MASISDHYLISRPTSEPASSAATLGLAMIMKNEAANLGRSLAPIAPYLDEMVVVDTGSNDQSRDIALALGAKVLDFKWINDFSAARNFALTAATTDFILWLDADNSLKPEGLDEFRRHLRPGDQKILWATEVVTPQSDRLLQKRVFPKHPAVYFEGPIHEQLVHPSHWPAISTKVEIQHWGYADLNGARQKGERNLELLINCPQTKAGEFYWLYQTGRTLFNLRRYPQALQWLKKAADASTANRPLWGHNQILLSLTLTRLGHHAEAEQVARELVAREPDYGPAYYHLGRLIYDSGQNQHQAGEYLETALILGAGDLIWGADPQIYHYRAAFMLGRIWKAQGRIISARQAYILAGNLDPKSPEPLFALAEIALDQGHKNEARGHLENVLKLAPKHRRAIDLFSAL